MKRLIATILILSCLLTALPLSASASQETKTRGGKLIALTFDDGPGAYTQRLLDGLAKRNVKVTFFALGQCAASYPNTLRRAFAEGHEIAQHTYTHTTLTSRTNEQVLWEVQHTDETLDNILGMDLDYLLRPPYGDCNDRVLSLIGTPAVFWSLDSLDWQLLNAQKVRDRIVAQAFDGAIVLVHDIHSPSVDGALMAIDTLLQQGYEFVTVSELYRRRGVSMTDGTRYYSCKNNGTDLGPIEAPNIQAKPIYGGYEITMTAAAGTKIYYSTDGSAPQTAYTGKFVLTAGEKLTAFACYAINRGRSETVTKELDTTPLEPLSISAKNGKFYISNPNKNVDVRYTTDGSRPSANSPLYSGGIDWFDGTLTFCAMGYGTGSKPVSYNVSAQGGIFADVSPNEWYYAEINWAATSGLLNGLGDYCYEPETGLTRAMFVTMLYRLMSSLGYDMSAAESSGFCDVAKGSWYEQAVCWSQAKELVLGYEDQTFRPDAQITREEMCTLLDRVLTLMEHNSQSAQPSFRDNAKISDWAFEAVGRLVSLGIIQGMGSNTFAPKETATRAQAAAVFHRLSKLLQK